MSYYDTSTGYNPPVPPIPESTPQANVVKKPGLFKTFAAAAGPVQLSRVILGIILGLLFILTWAGTGPAVVDAGNPSEWKSDLADASIKNEVNNGETKGAPQQSVVNGWYANDIAAVTASQNTYIAASSARNGTLLMLIGVGIAGEMIIRGFAGNERTKKQQGPSQAVGAQ
ncbi:hypothetical protein [Paenarthrobacter aurescens]|uniref:hypothetical protein n=1 Tax=Paenarthrobacter aurescens TaxID=43663 RepID=UPI0021BF9B33|nr:hypothetical protein [Paenarthrobacter aurescens]MCT9867816.1 hypothetical protein [Paenarthrobacter aurescens]